MNLPQTLTILDVEDLLADLGVPVDRTNIGRALQAQPIADVVPPAGRGYSWAIPPSALLAVIAACLRRREMRSSTLRHFALSLADFELRAARLLLVADLKQLVPRRLQRAVAKERREAQRRAEERAQRLREQEEAQRRAEERRQAADLKRIRDFATADLYFHARQRAVEARRPSPGAFMGNEAYEVFMGEWPATAPDGWHLPPAVLDAAVDMLRPYLRGTANTRPPVEGLLPDNIDWSAPWPWRREQADA